MYYKITKESSAGHPITYLVTVDCNEAATIMIITKLSVMDSRSPTITRVFKPVVPFCKVQSAIKHLVELEDDVFKMVADSQKEDDTTENSGETTHNKPTLGML